MANRKDPRPTITFWAIKNVKIIGAKFAQGDRVDPNRETFKFLGFIIVPICIEKNATNGHWTVQIETDSDEAYHFFKVMIEYIFQVK